MWSIAGINYTKSYFVCAEVGSDHHLVLMELRLKVQRSKVKVQQELRRPQGQMKEMYDGNDVERA